MNKKILTLPLIALTAGVSLAACSPSSHTSAQNEASAKAKASAEASALKNSKQAQADETQAENKLLSCAKISYVPTSVVHCAFPHGDTGEILHFAIKTYQVSDAKPGAARTAWAQGVAENALQQGQK